MKEFGIILDFRDRMITIDEIILPMRNINNLQGSSVLRALKHNHSLTMEPQSTQDATQRAMRILDTKGVGYLAWKWICISLESQMGCPDGSGTKTKWYKLVSQIACVSVSIFWY